MEEEQNFSVSVCGVRSFAKKELSAKDGERFFPACNISICISS